MGLLQKQERQAVPDVLVHIFLDAALSMSRWLCTSPLSPTLPFSLYTSATPLRSSTRGWLTSYPSIHREAYQEGVRLFDE